MFSLSFLAPLTGSMVAFSRTSYGIRVVCKAPPFHITYPHARTVIQCPPPRALKDNLVGSGKSNKDENNHSKSKSCAQMTPQTTSTQGLMITRATLR